MSRLLALLPAMGGWPRRGPAVQGPFALPDLPPLAADEVHVWRIGLARAPSELPLLRQVLGIDELARADRFHFPKHRDQFIAGRGLMRVVLGCYLQCPPSELRFTYNLYGKPALVEAGTLRFNLAHSHGLAVCAVTRGREVGIDVERIRSQVSSDGIAERHFSARELATLRSLPAEQREEAFFHCWTRKEAYLKATGRGLSVGLDTFDVTVAPDEAAQLLEVRGQPEEAERWSLRRLDVPPGYVAAIVAEGSEWRLWCGDWP